jgi:AraC-like DNA-binding protein
MIATTTMVPQDPPTDIAYECGFADAAPFARLFKEAAGMAPTTYRESMATSPQDS